MHHVEKYGKRLAWMQHVKATAIYGMQWQKNSKNTIKRVKKRSQPNAKARLTTAGTRWVPHRAHRSHAQCWNHWHRTVEWRAAQHEWSWGTQEEWPAAQQRINEHDTCWIKSGPEKDTVHWLLKKRRTKLHRQTCPNKHHMRNNISITDNIHKYQALNSSHTQAARIFTCMAWYLQIRGSSNQFLKVVAFLGCYMKHFAWAAARLALHNTTCTVNSTITGKTEKLSHPDTTQQQATSAQKSQQQNRSLTNLLVFLAPSLSILQYEKESTIEAWHNMREEGTPTWTTSYPHITLHSRNPVFLVDQANTSSTGIQSKAGDKV